MYLLHIILAVSCCKLVSMLAIAFCSKQHRVPVQSRWHGCEPLVLRKNKKSSFIFDFYSPACFTLIIFPLFLWMDMWWKRSLVTLASGKVSLKNVGSHDKRVKKVLAVQRCVTITALVREYKKRNRKENKCVESTLTDPATLPKVVQCCWTRQCSISLSTVSWFYKGLCLFHLFDI